MGDIATTAGMVTTSYIGRTVVEASAFDRLAGGGPLTEEGLFLLMTEMMDNQSRVLQAKVNEFREQTRLQAKYAELRELLVAAHGAASGSDGKYLTRDDLIAIGIPSDEVASLCRAGGGDANELVDPQELVRALNLKIFGTDERLYVKGVDLANFKCSSTEFAEEVTQKLDAAQSANCMDTTLLTTELSQLVNQQNRLSSMFSNMLQKLHETAMSVIRNM